MKLSLSLSTFTAAMAVAPTAFASNDASANQEQHSLLRPSNHRKLQTLEQCEGSCSSDADCTDDLRCFSIFTPRYNAVFPGCSTQPPTGTNWCYNPADTAGRLFFFGNNNEPDGVFPLQKCQGDCDEDSDCASGLQCFQRDGEPSVPGCLGVGAVDGVDYCYDPADDRLPGGPESDSDDSNDLQFVGNPPALPLQNCQGDCDSNDDCEGDLLCFQRSGSDADDVPGCEGAARDDVDYCYDPNPRVGGGPEEPALEKVMLLKCQGDCDTNDDCLGDLQCFQSLPVQFNVPGCDGLVTDTTDYCYDPADV